MATLLLAQAGTAVGAAIGGSFLGVSSAAIGGAAFATVGRVIDAKLLGGSAEPVETGGGERLRLGAASEGIAIPRIFGRLRTPGHLIWSTNFFEMQTVITETSGGGGGGKGGGGRSQSARGQKKFAYYISVAYALCQGSAQRIDRIWADGQEISPNSLNLRFYNGSKTQMPDAKIEAVEGVNNAPAYRGLAYVVIEEFALEPYGNRIPRMEFEVIRQAEPPGNAAKHHLINGTKAVAMLPGGGEYILAKDTVYAENFLGDSVALNEHTRAGKSDFQVAIQALDGELANCKSVALVVSWFGDDLRAGHCTLRPKTESTGKESTAMPWRVSGLTRATARNVPLNKGRPIYGGTPSDQAVIQAIRHLKEKGFRVTYYPFILMDIVEGNTLPDPWEDKIGQPALPWRGRITISKAPGLVGTTDKTAAAAQEVAAFFGACTPSDFEQSNSDSINFTGGDEWSYRRFLLHSAKLCELAGGVDGFLIGTEMRSLTQIRSAPTEFPAVGELKKLAADIRGILGAGTKLTYAADWSEYFGYHPQDGSGDVLFHLDPLWADTNIDSIGIDNYMPLSDWRDTNAHLDISWGEIYNLNYLKANIEGGEGYDWYYSSEQDRDAQNRTKITDGAHNEPWVFRYKDLRGWWKNSHYNRVGGIRQIKSTAWVPESKPLWFTEIGCAAIDKGTNQPNKFIDVLSSEAGRPYYSTGGQDELMQQSYFAALYEYWGDPTKNPTSKIYNKQMVDMENAYVWAWDARPYPAFPNLRQIWSDGANHALGHWITGRTGQQSIGQIVKEICATSGVSNINTSLLYGQVNGYRINSVETARASLQPLMLAYGFDAIEQNGIVSFKSRGSTARRKLTREQMALESKNSNPIRLIRAPDAETVGRVRLRYLDAANAYAVRVSETLLSDDPALSVSQSEFDLTLSAHEAQEITKRWLIEARIARDTVEFSVPPSQIDLNLGDIVEIDLDGEVDNYRISAIAAANFLKLTGQRVEASVYKLPRGAGVFSTGTSPALSATVSPAPGLVLFLDLPLLKGDETPHQPYLAVLKNPWAGIIACYSALGNSNFSQVASAEISARIGKTESALGKAHPNLLDRGARLQVKMGTGQLSSVDMSQLLNGRNLAAIGHGSDGPWEVFQFQTARLISPDTYELSLLLRGQAGTDADIPLSWPVGSYFVMLDGALSQVDLPISARGLERTYRTGLQSQPYDSACYRSEKRVFNAIGLRPFRPAHVRSRLGSDGAVQLSWIRRTRIDGDSWQSFEVPLGEDRQLYRVRILSGNKLLRQSEVNTERFTYSKAEQDKDQAVFPLAAYVAQISDQFGPGPEKGVIING